ncbi:MAG TPA: hypothetical protein VF725_01855 [Ktedonobacterales bacterium]
MSTHAQFVALTLAGLALTAPALVVAWRGRLPVRRLATTLYLVGFALIVATLIIDPILRPPLFYHGFVPGVGIGCVALALALIVQARRRV